jgi:protein TonB
VIPEYPTKERRLGIEGKVVLELVIDKDGNLLSVKVLNSTNEDFAQAALKAIKASTFRAAIEDGEPVKSRAILPIRFLLED